MLFDSVQSSGLGVIRVNGENTKLKHKWQPGISAIFQFKANSRSCNEEKLEIPKEARTKISVGKDDV